MKRSHLTTITMAGLLVFVMAANAFSQEAPALKAAEEPALPKLDVPRQKDALEQFHHAMMTWYRPAARAKGDERLKLCRQAVPAFQAVWVYFPKSESKLVLLEAHFYQGMCHKALSERREAATAFLAAYRMPVPGAALDKTQADLITYHRHARRQLMDLLDVLTPAEREGIRSAPGAP